jgi:hypothetical protein
MQKPSNLPVYVDKGFPDSGDDGRLADGSIPVALGRELKRLHLDLRDAFLVAKVKQSRLFNELVSLDLDDPALIQFWFLTAKDLSAFGTAGGHAIEYRQNVLAAEIRILPDVFNKVSAGAAGVVII